MGKEPSAWSRIQSLLNSFHQLRRSWMAPKGPGMEQSPSAEPARAGFTLRPEPTLSMAQEGSTGPGWCQGVPAPCLWHRRGAQGPE